MAGRGLQTDLSQVTRRLRRYDDRNDTGLRTKLAR